MTIPTAITNAIAKLDATGSGTAEQARASRALAAEILVDPTRGLDSVTTHVRNAASEEGMTYIYSEASRLLARVVEIEPKITAEAAFLKVIMNCATLVHSMGRSTNDVDTARIDGKVSALNELRWIFGL